MSKLQTNLGTSRWCTKLILFNKLAEFVLNYFAESFNEGYEYSINLHGSTNSAYRELARDSKDINYFGCIRVDEDLSVKDLTHKLATLLAFLQLLLEALMCVISRKFKTSLVI